MIGFQQQSLREQVATVEHREPQISPEKRKHLVRELLREEGFEQGVKYLREFMLLGHHPLREQHLIEKLQAIKARYFDLI